MIRLVVYLHVDISESPVLEDRQVEAMRERQKMRWIQEEIRQVPALTQGSPETWESGYSWVRGHETGGKNAGGNPKG